MGEIFIRAGICWICAAIAALAMGFAAEWGRGPAGPAAAGLPVERSGISVAATIRPENIDQSAPVGSQIPARPDVRLASLETQVDAAAEDEETRAEAPASTAPRASFDERFASAFDRQPVEEDESVVFGRPVSPVPLVRPSPAPLGTVALPARPRATSVLPADPAKHAAAAPGVRRPAPDAATAARPPLPAASGQPVGTAEAPSDSLPPPDADSRTAIYDIAAHAVYLPNGDRLEAHSGLGSSLDDPRYVNVKGRGPTPPNVYDLVLRKQLFHGVRAIRLIPAGEGKMFGRGGMLAHSYMLGPNGQSNGCVSFDNYPAFLNAFLKGEVDRLVVVDHLAAAPSPRGGLGWLPEPLRNLFKRS